MADYDQFHKIDDDPANFGKSDWTAPPVRCTPPVALRLADRFGDLLSQKLLESMVNQFEDLKESAVRNVRDLVQRSDDKELKEDFRRRWDALEQAFRDWGLFDRDAMSPDEVKDSWRQFRDHLRGFMAWLRDLRISETIVNNCSPAANVRLPKEIQDLTVSSGDHPEICCGGNRLEPTGCTAATWVLEYFGNHSDQHHTLKDLLDLLGERMGGDEHALEQQISKLRGQLRRQGGCLEAVADHFYNKSGKLGLWSHPKRQRRRRS